jgi:hypothetical protein
MWGPRTCYLVSEVPGWCPRSRFLAEMFARARLLSDAVADVGGGGGVDHSGDVQLDA